MNIVRTMLQVEKQIKKFRNYVCEPDKQGVTGETVFATKCEDEA
jgi:hypothetical protein